MRVSTLQVVAPDGLPEFTTSTNVAEVIAGATRLADGDIVVVTSKVISKAEGRVQAGDREDAIAEETSRLVATRGTTRIVRNRLGLTMAAAGVDASNVRAGHVVLLPEHRDESARKLRRALLDRLGTNVAVVITDTSGRAWREGQTDIAIGAAGLCVLEDFNGLVDAYGNHLVVTLPAVADEIAGAAELAQGKLAGRPVAVVRGRSDLVLKADDDGPGAIALVRREGADLFGYGAREAVIRALAGNVEDRPPFGEAVPLSEVAEALSRTLKQEVLVDAEAAPFRPTQLLLPAGAERCAVEAVTFVHGWAVKDWFTDSSGTTATS